VQEIGDEENMKNMTDGRADEAWFSGERNKVGGDVEEKRVGACHQFDCMVAGRAGGKKLASPAGGFVSAVPAAPDRPVLLITSILRFGCGMLPGDSPR